MGLLRMSANPVKDVSNIEGSNFIYRVKVDGEHNWLVDAGSCWYYCRNDPKLKVVSYRMKTGLLEFSNTPTVIRVEVLTNGSLVLLDVMSNGSNVLPINRSLDVTYSSYMSIPRLPSSIIVRADHASIDGAKDEAMLGLLPNDGIVAVDIYNSLTYRIKEPTVDLMCKGMFLYSINESKQLTKRLGALEGMKEDRVYECSVFTHEGAANSHMIEVAISKFHERHDKVLPNSDIVYNRIIDVATDKSSPSTIISREVTSASYDVRAYVYEYAVSCRSSGRTVIDVGSGRLQSLSIMDKYRDSVTWLLVDPLLKLPDNARVSSWINLTQMDNISIVNAMREMTVTYSRVPLVYCFSVSYCLPIINRLNYTSIPQLGCAFLYDKADDRGPVFDYDGVFMRIDKATGEGEVRLGPDAVFTEDPLTTSALSGLTVSEAKSLVLSCRERSAPVKNILESLFIITK